MKKRGKNYLSMKRPLLFACCLLAAQLAAANPMDKDHGTVLKIEQNSQDKKHTINGIIYGNDGEILPGATVTVKGNPTIGTSANLDGKFVLSIPQKTKILIVSFVGYEPQELVLKENTINYVVKLKNTTDIDEVVVTGIITKRKDTFTGSSATFSGKELSAVGVQNPIASLKSLDPSFNVLDNNLFGSDPNRLPDIEIRGKSSMLGMRDQMAEDPNQPLFILDGFESNLETIYNLDISRIESMTILKDAASTAIYGSKAANGVVVVETIKPKVGQLRVSYNGSLDISMPDLTSYNLMNAREKLEFEKLAGKYNASNGNLQEMIEKDNLYQKHKADIAGGVDTYWLSEPLRTGINHRHSLYVDGGSDGFMFGVGLNYNGVNGVMKKSEREVLGGNIDLIYRVGKFQFTNKFSAQQTTSANPTVSFQEYAQANPYYKKYNEDGQVSKFLANNSFENQIPNPMYNDQLNSRDEAKAMKYTNNFIAEYNPIRDLKLRAKFGISQTTNEKEVFFSPDETRFEKVDILKKGSYTYRNNKSTSYEGDLTAIYATLLQQKHRINLALGFNIAETNTVLQGYSAQGFPSGDFTHPSYSNGFTDNSRPSYSKSARRSISTYLSGGYAFLDRYLLDVNYRMNGASVFGANKKYINTWSVGIGWSLHNEKFIQDNLPWINYFKIRASIGTPGNMNYDSAMSLTTFRYSYAAYNYFGLGSILEAFGNEDLEWQTTLDRNLGLDLTLFDNRLNMNLDYYYKTTDPLLISIGMPSSSGLPSQYNSELKGFMSSYNTNMGKQIAKGFNGSIQYYILRNFDKRLTWSVRGSLRMEKIKLDGIGNSLNTLNKYGQSRSTQRFYDGADPDDIWAVRSAGIDPATGRELFIKKDGTYTYDFSYDDEVVIGNTRPDAEGIIGTNFAYKGFTAGVTFRYRLGGYAFNSAVYSKVENISSYQLRYNQDKRALYDRWQKPGDIAQFKNIADAASTPMSSRFVQKENSLTLESFQVGYEFDPQFVKRYVGVNGLRVNAYMNNIFRVSTVKQERGTSYPFARNISFALSFTL